MKRRIRKAPLLAAVLMTASMLASGCGETTKVSTPASETEVTDLTGGQTEKTEDGDSKTIQILATTDSHGRFLPYDYAINMPDTSGSLAQIATKVSELRAENENTILVDAGDTIQDNSESLFINTDENPMMIAMNKIGYDVMALGNHEFNYGMDALSHITDQFQGEVLCGNVYDGDERIAEPYTIVERDGIKIGIIGMVTPNITKWDAANLEGYTVDNPVDETKKAIEELKKQDVNAIVEVMHIGVSQEYGEDGSSAIEILEECPEIDAFVAAHFHVKIPGDYYYDSKSYSLNEEDNTVTTTTKDGTAGEATLEEYNTAKENGTVIIEPYKWAQALGQINMTFTKDAAGAYTIANKGTDVTADVFYMSGKDTDPVAEDTELADSLQEYSETAIADANTIIGELKGGDLVPENEITGIEQAKLQPTAMMTLIHNVQRYYGEELCGHPIDVSSAAVFQNGQNIAEGEIKKCDTANIYKFDNTLYVLKIKGKQLKEYMEWSYTYYNTYKPGDLTISFSPDIPGYNFDMFAGINYQVDVSKEAGERIVNLTREDGSKLQDTDELYMTVNNYRANTQLLSYGIVFQEGEELPELVGKTDGTAEFGDGRIRDLIGSYIQDVKGGVIEPDCEENWSIIGNDWDADQRAKAVECANAGTIDLTGESGEQTSENSVTITWDMVKDK